MQRSTRSSSRYAAAWFLLVAGFWVVVGLWGVHLAEIIGSSAESSKGVPVARPTATTGAVSDFPTGLTPPGVSGIIPPRSCIYSESVDGQTNVMSADTGSLLSPAQAVNCTK